MTRIIGFEGALHGALVSYGAAALLLDEGTVKNSVSKAIAPLDENEALGNFTKFRSPLELDGDFTEFDLIVLAIDRSLRVADFLVPDTGRLGGYLQQRRDKPYIYYIFQDRRSFQQYCNEATWAITDVILQEGLNQNDVDELIRACLVLSPRDALLLALRVHFSAKPESARRSAERLLSSEAIPTFREFLAALSQPKDSEYQIKYERGIAGDGGLDLEVAVRQLRALRIVHQKLEPEIRRRLPFIGDAGQIPELRFQTLRAASAQFGFGVLGQTLRDRVIRYYELQLLAEVVSGKLPSNLIKDITLQDQLTELLAPPDTDVQHRPIGSPNLEPVERTLQRSADESPLTEDFVSILGFVEGVARKVQRAELRVSRTHVITVPTDTDGDGKSPLGVEDLRSGQGSLFAPMHFILLRRLFPSGRVSWFLRRLTSVQHGTSFMVNAVPSSVVEKGMCKAASFKLTRDGSRLAAKGVCSLEVIANGFEAASEWLGCYHEQVKAFELEAAIKPDTYWIPPLPFPAPSALRRIVAVLGVREGPIRISELITDLNDRFSVRVRASNTFREIRAHEDLFVWEGDYVEVGLSEWGRLWFCAMRGYEMESDRSLPLLARRGND